MIRSVLYLPPRDAAAGPAVEAYFRTEGVLDRAVAGDGCLAASLLRPHGTTPGPDAPLLVTALWSSPAGYRRWVDDPWRRSRTADLAALLAAPIGPGGRGALYYVVQHVEEATGHSATEDGGNGTAG